MVISDEQLDVGHGAALQEGLAKVLGDEHGQALANRFNLVFDGADETMLYEQGKVFCLIFFRHVDFFPRRREAAPQRNARGALVL